MSLLLTKPCSHARGCSLPCMPHTGSMAPAYPRKVVPCVCIKVVPLATLKLPSCPVCCAGGSNLVPVSTSMMKQIAGRAGRRSSQWPNGLATCRNPADVARLQEALAVRGGGASAAIVLLPDCISPRMQLQQTSFRALMRSPPSGTCCCCCRCHWSS